MNKTPEPRSTNVFRRTMAAIAVVAGIIHEATNRGTGLWEKTLLVSAGCIVLAWAGVNVLRRRR